MQFINYVIVKIIQNKKYIPYYFEHPFSDELLDRYYKKYPIDYLNFIKNNGEGIIGDYIRIYAPDKAEILEKYWRKTSAKLISEKFLPDENTFIAESLFIGDTLDSDQIIYFKRFYYAYSFQGPSGFFEKTGKNINDVLNFYNSGKYWESIDVSQFTPFNSSWFFDILNYFNINVELNEI